MRELNNKEVNQVSGGVFDFGSALDGISKQIDGFLKNTIDGLNTVFDGVSKLINDSFTNIKDVLGNIFGKKS